MGQPEFLANVHAFSTTLSPSRDEVIGYDLEGRPLHWFVNGETFKRSLASDVFGRRTVAGARRRWQVGEGEAEELFARARALASEAAGRLEELTVAGGGGEDADGGRRRQLADRLELAAGWTPERLRSERERFLRVYQPVSILPPDQYQSVVLQASFGCSWNRCTFCTFYQDRPFRIRPPQEFEAHAAGVRGLLGAAAEARRSIFLADGNALVLANSKLRPLFEIARGAFPGRPIDAFVDVFSGDKKAPGQWSELRELGLRRVAIGVETGDDELLSWLNKPGSAAAAADFVARLKSAGLLVSVIFMVGAGGRRFAEQHLAGSLELLERLPLAEGDLVYLSPFVLQAGSAYAEKAVAAGVEALEEGEAAEQYAALSQGARARVPRAKVALYHIDEFVY